MDAQKPPTPGWYRDPTGPGTRYWDGARWGRAATPARRILWPVIAGVAALALVAVCCVGAFTVAGSGLGPGQDEIRLAADDVQLPASLTLVTEGWTGNRLCLEECYQLSRQYSSPSSREDTYRLVTEAIANAGFERGDSWGGFDAGRDPYSLWRRSGRTIEVTVFSAAARSGPTAPIDSSRDTQADLKYR